MKNLFNRLLLLIILFVSCKVENSEVKKESIYDYNENVILGDPINIIISEGEKVIYKIESDKLVDSLNNILLSGGVAIAVFEDDGSKINDIYSNKAIVYNKSDSMSAYGNVKIISSINGDELFTEKIMLYNKTRSVVSKEEVLFINNKDSLKGIGFWSDFDMENWKIEKPIGAIIKD